MSGRLIDFDAFRSEQQKEPVRLRIGGQVYDLPPDLPASVALDAIRLRSEGDDAEVSGTQVEKIAREIFGEEILAELLRKHRVSFTELGELIKLAFDAYNERSAAAPNRATRRASKTRSRSSSTGPS